MFQKNRVKEAQLDHSRYVRMMRLTCLNQWINHVNHRFWSCFTLLTSSAGPASPREVGSDEDEDGEKKKTSSYQETLHWKSWTRSEWWTWIMPHIHGQYLIYKHIRPHSKCHLYYRPEKMNTFTFKSVKLHSLDSLTQSYLMEHRWVMQALLMRYEL